MNKANPITPPKHGAAAPPIRRAEGHSGRLAPEDSARITRQVTALTVFMAVILAGGKFLIWQRSGSVGVLSSLVHSALDCFGALSSFFAVRYAAKRPNLSYRFGMGKAESFAAVFQVCLIILAATHLLETASHSLAHDHDIQGDYITFAGLGALMALGLCLLMIQTRAVKATGSLAVRGDRAHYLADFLATALVVFGLLAALYTPFHQADSLVAILMALWLFWTAFKIARLAWAQLMDKELPESDRQIISQIALSDKNILAIHDLRTRASGPHIHIQMRLDLPDHLSLSDAHHHIIGLEHRLMDAFPSADILIHPHPVGCADTHGNQRFRIDGDDCQACHDHNPPPP